MGLAELAAKINWTDVLILILLLKISYNGFSRGFSSEVMPLVGAFAALIVSLHYYSFFGQFVSSVTPLSRAFSDLFSFILLSIIIITISRLIRSTVMKMVRVEVISFLEHLGGVLLGMMRAAVIASLILVILVLVPFEYIDISVKDRSLMGKDFLRIGPVIYDKLAGIFPTIDQVSEESMERRFTRERWRK